MAQTWEEAEQAVRENLDDAVFGEASRRVLIEEYLSGEEASMLAFTDGKTVLPMSSAQDHKAIYEGDKGPNTGGMGAYSPAPVVTPELEKEVLDTILKPTVDGLRERGMQLGFLHIEAGPLVRSSYHAERHRPDPPGQSVPSSS